MSEHKDEGAQQAGTSPEVPAALTAQQWAYCGFDNFCGSGLFWNPANGYFEFYGYDNKRFASDGWMAHAIAAVMLNGHPFGFTREDVEVLRGALENIRQREFLNAPGAAGSYAFYSPRLNSISSRIAALLPPAETEEQ